MKNILEQVKSFCQENNLINHGDKILLAVSGGPDSTALLYTMFALKNEFSIKIAVAHIEHGLRGESSLRDQLFVKKIAENLKVDFYNKNVNVTEARKPGESIEEACRRVRYHFFFDTLQRFGFDKIATGHTLDDNIETIIYRFLSGTGPSGITGIHPKNACIVHPLLGCTKEEIVDYLKREKLNYRTDETNIDTSIIRNKIRLKIVPQLESVNFNFKSHILNLMNIIKNENEILDKLTESMISSMIVEEARDIITIKYGKFFYLHKAIKRRVVITLVRKLTDSDSFIKKNYVSF
ncbi:MAG: tRNA lysidine(34) synthetase TilS, partial [Spirochaetes bacterium]|nr:tRNA lysidine(34) synthetase TilS [Spirochaetota bacterium]